MQELVTEVQEHFVAAMSHTISRFDTAYVSLIQDQVSAFEHLRTQLHYNVRELGTHLDIWDPQRMERVRVWSEQLQWKAVIDSPYGEQLLDLIVRRVQEPAACTEIDDEIQRIIDQMAHDVAVHWTAQRGHLTRKPRRRKWEIAYTKYDADHDQPLPEDERLRRHTAKLAGPKPGIAAPGADAHTKHVSWRQDSEFTRYSTEDEPLLVDRSEARPLAAKEEDGRFSGNGEGWSEYSKRSFETEHDLNSFDSEALRAENRRVLKGLGVSDIVDFTVYLTPAGNVLALAGAEHVLFEHCSWDYDRSFHGKIQMHAKGGVIERLRRVKLGSKGEIKVECDIDRLEAARHLLGDLMERRGASKSKRTQKYKDAQRQIADFEGAEGVPANSSPRHLAALRADTGRLLTDITGKEQTFTNGVELSEVQRALENEVHQKLRTGDDPEVPSRR
ncbi:hypothetical protein AB0D66_31265 [Streptomyces sp. NPDC048270]|uniref:hypothetical protein n=1 Tax=Streptomyces sp. NPDC048270 TaxID=3154615 RepID=UPI0033E5D158